MGNHLFFPGIPHHKREDPSSVENAVNKNNMGHTMKE
jgi:hypothetical protein